MEFDLKMTYTARDYTDFIRESLLGKKSNKIFLIVIFLILLYPIILAFTNGLALLPVILEILPPVIIFLLIFFVIYPLIYRHAFKSDKTLQEEQSWHLTKDGITIQNSHGNNNLRLEDFHRVRFGRKIIAIYISTQKALMIPRRCFSSKEEEQKIEDFIKANYVKSRSRKDMKENK